MARTLDGATRRDADLTAKARIRNAALDLFGAHGIDATSLRAVAGEAGVTVGLVVHHYGTKESLREAVELSIIDLFTEAIETVPLHSVPAGQLATVRDGAVADMLAANQRVVDYLRRAILDGGGERGDVVSRLSQLCVQQINELREAGVASTKHTVGEQVVTIMVRQLGRLFLQPLVDRIFSEFSDDAVPTSELVINVRH